MDRLQDLLKHRLNNHNLNASTRAAEILFDANQLLLNTFSFSSKMVKAYRLEQGVLYIRAENPVWSQEVWGIHDQLLNALQKQYGKNVISKVLIKWFDNSLEVD